MSVEPDRPRNQPEDRVVYLPVKVTYEGLADDTNGPYFKGLVQMSPAYPATTYSISESQVIESPLEAAAQAMEDYGHRTRRHVSKVEWSDEVEDYVDNCDQKRGDRCDLVAAYNHAASMVRNMKKGNS